MPKYRDEFGNVSEIGAPELNPDLVRGKTQVPDTTALGTGVFTAPAPIPVEFKNQNPDSVIYPNLAPSIESFGLGQTEQQTQDLTETIMSQRKALGEEVPFRQEKAKEFGVPELGKTQLDLFNQLKQFQLEREAIPIQTMQQFAGRATLAGVQGVSEERLRQNAIKAYELNSRVQATQGLLQSAQLQIEQAAEAKFGTKKKELETNLANLQLIKESPQFTKDQKDRAAKQELLKLNEERQIKQQEENYKAGQVLATAVFKNYPDNQAAALAANQVSNLNPSDPQYLSKVYALVGKYQADPQKIAQAIADEQYKQAQIANIQADTRLTNAQRDKLLKEVSTPTTTPTYVPGSNPTVDNWARLIIAGQATITNVPNPRGSTLRSQVIDAIANSGQLLLSDKDREKLAQIDNAQNIVGSMKALLEGESPSSIITRPIIGPLNWLSSVTQFEDNLAAFRTAREGFVSNIARALGEKGTLAEGDVRRAIANVPKMSDTEAVAQRKWGVLLGILEKGKEAIIKTSTQPLNQPQGNPPKGTDGAAYGHPGYVSDGTQWVLK